MRFGPLDWREDSYPTSPIVFTCCKKIEPGLDLRWSRQTYSGQFSWVRCGWEPLRSTAWVPVILVRLEPRSAGDYSRFSWSWQRRCRASWRVNGRELRPHRSCYWHPVWFAWPSPPPCWRWGIGERFDSRWQLTNFSALFWNAIDLSILNVSIEKNIDKCFGTTEEPSRNT